MNQGIRLEAPIIGISRFSVGRDGNGITTLVAFQGCTLRCKYCINPDCWKPEDNFKHYTPQDLFDELKKDDVYFRSTDGGVTFGGGEPALRADFIAEFRKICGTDWKIRIETSLNCEPKYMEILAPVIDEWIIDTKAEKPTTYLRYTGGRQSYLKFNLNLLTKQLDVSQEKITLKVPIIPDYVSEAEVRDTFVKYRRQFPNAKIDVVRYVTEQLLRDVRDKERTLKGKELCNLLTAVRHDIAERYDIDLPKRECTHQGDCPGTCPLCEQEVEHLSNELRNKKIEKPEVSKNLRDGINSFDDNCETDCSNEPLLPAGIMVPPENEVLQLEGDVIPPEDFPPLEGLVVDVPPYYEYKKVVFKECALAGVAFHLKYDDELWDELEEGVELALVRHKDNKHDPNAVAVALADDYDGDPEDFDFDFILGYVPRTDNAEIAAMLDAGYDDKLSAKITKFSRHGNINNRIRITVYLETSEPVFVRPDLLRIQKIDSDELRNIIDSLQDDGTCYMRFLSAIPPGSQYHPPMVGDKIVMVYEHPKNFSILLMRIIAENEDCRMFTSEDIDAEDDCSPYILTNILGPIDVPKYRNGFIKAVMEGYLQPSEYLPKELSHRFEMLFKIYLANHIYRSNIDADPSIDDPE